MNMNQCLEHESVKTACAQIPELVKDVRELICSLNGEIGKPGWMTKQELRMAALERQMSVVMRVAWGILGTAGLALVGAIFNLVMK